MEKKRQVQKEATRQRILDTARRVYARDGFSATTAEIAREAGVSHGAVFAHFSSREALVTEVVRDCVFQVARETHRLFTSEQDLEALLKVQVAVLSAHEDFYIRLLRDQALLPEGARLAQINAASVFALHLGPAFEAARAAGRLRDVPPQSLFNIWMGTLHYYLLNRDLFSPDEPLLPRYGPQLIETFLTLIHT